MNKLTFYILSFTWGLPITLAGIVTAAILLTLGYKPKRYGACWYFEIGEKCGGFNLGPVFLIQNNPSTYLKNHEHGHAIQNCYFGIFTPFVIVIPSVIRYWYREYREHINEPCTTGYYDIWFEKQASELGTKYATMWNKEG